MKQLVKKEKGFTIIEVVLVLAIAGLIFMVVFLAVPGLQRSQRDTQRKQDLGRLVSTITSIQSNNKGSVPNAIADYECEGDFNTDTNTCATAMGQVYQELVSGGSRFSDPSTQRPYAIVAVVDSNAADAADDTLDETGDFAVGINVICGNSLADVFNAADGSNNASFAVAMHTEGGFYCQQG